MPVERGNANERQGSKLPFGYYLQPDADLLRLLRPDCSLVAAFSAMGADPLELEAMVREDADL
ncbi:MAG TPA: hypothetical protein VK357_09950 [Rubrobacteraceae bacterium]|jgi:hypothetical protein|nr:hypothetical protein [Rubrobacteraceae bacterium]